ncbi:hypothetical protein M9H77_17258 [Catharanthus roseus]|uniref:Uncharacterized protein n=1 Tax=Catharanthus roseus TaxID=4058 RepID=A0ACC0B432_CATRO|nr:hypothetical protein M9H77_17258 [Catharanthus roseus]
MKDDHCTGVRPEIPTEGVFATAAPTIPSHLSQNPFLSRPHPLFNLPLPLLLLTPTCALQSVYRSVDCFDVGNPPESLTLMVEFLIENLSEDLFWAIRGDGGAAFGITTEWIVYLLTVPKHVTVFNVSRTPEQNATDLGCKWQFVGDRIDENLLIRCSSTMLPQQNVTKRELLKLSSLPYSLGELMIYLKNELDSICTLFLRPPNQWTRYFAEHNLIQKETDFKKALKGIWKFLLETNVGRTQLQFTPYRGRLNDFSESSIPFPHRARNIFMIHYIVFWDEEENAREGIDWNRRLYKYMTKFVSKSPRSAYFNYKDLDLGVNKIVGNTSYRQARVSGAKYFKNNFDRLIRMKT